MDNLKRHEPGCKERQCAVRHLEVQLGIEIEVDIHSKQCRFCKKEFTQKCHCTRHKNTCKKKMKYLSYLEDKLKEQNKENMKDERSVINNTNNNTYNDNRTINININSLGNENMNYITVNSLKQLWKNVKSDEEGLAETIKLIHGNRDHPENHNIIYTNLRSNTALVKVNDMFEYKNINEVLKDVSANTLDLIVLNSDYDSLHKAIKERYEKVCEDDEMNKQAVILTKTELYNCYKNGIIQR